MHFINIKFIMNAKIELIFHDFILFFGFVEIFNWMESKFNIVGSHL